MWVKDENICKSIFDFVKCMLDFYWVEIFINELLDGDDV